MSELFNQGLLITAIGMGLVFVALILLWGLMAFMSNLGAKKEPKFEAPAPVKTPADEVVETNVPESNDLRLKAAVAAVAVALGLQKSTSTLSPKTPNMVSSWLVARRSGQFNQNALISNRKSRGSAR